MFELLLFCFGDLSVDFVGENFLAFLGGVDLVAGRKCFITDGVLLGTFSGF